MNKTTLAICIFILLTGCINSNSSNKDSKPIADSSGVENPAPVSYSTNAIQSSTQNGKYFPFELQNINQQFNIAAFIESESLYPKYYNLFKKYGYEGNGYCWEGHIKQILEKINKPLLAQIDFDPEGSTFFAIAKNKESQLKFVNY
jgi:hypothetical protein